MGGLLKQLCYALSYSKSETTFTIQIPPICIVKVVSDLTSLYYQHTQMRISEIPLYWALYWKMLSQESTIGSGWDFNHAELSRRRFQRCDRICRNSFLRVSKVSVHKCWGNVHVKCLLADRQMTNLQKWDKRQRLGCVITNYRNYVDKRRRLGCVNPASRLLLAAGGGEFNQQILLPWRFISRLYCD